VVMGTVAYMAPETALGMRAVEPRSDLYAVGVILYEMLAGIHPFAGASVAERLGSVLRDDPPPLQASIRAAIPSSYADTPLLLRPR